MNVPAIRHGSGRVSRQRLSTVPALRRETLPDPLPSLSLLGGKWQPGAVQLKFASLHGTSLVENPMRTNLALLLILSCFVSLPGAFAAPPRRVKLKGQVAAVSPGKIMVTDDQAKIRTFNILPTKEVGITVQGKLALTDLKPGALIRVEGALKGNALEGEVSKITVYSASDGYTAGIVQDSPDQPAVITGTVKLIKDDALTLLAGKKKITAKLAQEVAVNVDSKDYSLAPTGSTIEADGYETKDGSVNAKKIVITLGKVERKDAKPQEAKTAKAEKKKDDKK